MATKTISITENAYKRLANLKNENESFSMVIERVTKKSDFENLKKLYGILKGKAGKEFEKSILDARKSRERLRDKRIKEQLVQWRG
ncbi:antitoxin VapB family protein [Candidatus Pacearchaeota archaeon]|nr:antitoxin VapB family protein [Candidatus Pacearchaeota archaeon]